MKISKSDGKHIIQWKACMQLDDLDFADDLAILFHTHEQIQVKPTSVAETSASAGLNIHKGIIQDREIQHGEHQSHHIW
ncbi:unnamed protein product [Schistosoma margrebowiei]|uniref:Uncharacterized protein n=1 Tax=Schistosoma margrebowiei TaxID=48269 RepID=A0A183M4D7_9TREM|nr:unnamed protein product [Schistosoma margrebowiei]